MKEKLVITPVPLLLIEQVRLAAQEEIELPPIPTYDVELADGTIVQYEHNETTLETPEEKAKWKIYSDALNRQHTHSATKVMELLLASGIEIEEEILLTGKWRKLQEHFKIKIPTDEIELKIHYLRTQVLATPDELNEIFGKIMEASGIDKSLLKAARNMFRGELRQEPDTPRSTSGTDPLEEEGEVARLQPLHGVGNSESLESYSIAVGLPQHVG